MPVASPFAPSIDQTIYSLESSFDNTGKFFAISGSKPASTTQSHHEILVDRPTVFRNLRVYVTAKPDISESIQIFLIVNDVQLSLMVAINSTTTLNAWESDVTDTVTCLPGDRVCFQVVPSGTSPTATIQTVTMTRETQ